MDKLGPYLLGPNNMPENGIYTGNAEILSLDIPDNSLSLILADPVYQNIADYRWTTEMAVNKLIDKGNLVLQTSQQYLPEIFWATRNTELNFVWLIAERFRGGNPIHGGVRIINTWKPYLWWTREKMPRRGQYVFDQMAGGGRSKRIHKWEDSVRFFLYIIEQLTDIGDIIFDPFTGSGTVPAACKMLGRSYLAFEIDPTTADLARERVANTQLPLPGLQVEQSTFYSDALYILRDGIYDEAPEM